MQNIKKYIEKGISIDGNPNDGYKVFTIPTQHFKISSLDELTPERFEQALLDKEKRMDFEGYLSFLTWKDFHTNIDFNEYIKENETNK